jgi:radical SAM superfamily enzyme YgiQ (UPF0313 family)
MKILLLGFNIQENIFPLGLSYILGYTKKFHPDVEIKLKEFGFGHRFNYDVNKHIELTVISYILMNKPDLVAFSCYIWSVDAIKNICKAIKKINPNIKIILGGADMNENTISNDIDFIISGEGEIAFVDVIDHIKNNKPLDKVHNIIYMNDNKVIKNEEIQIKNLDNIPFPYLLSNKKNYTAVRLETSRGCPFGCKFCLYAKNTKVRYFSIEYLQKNITYLFEHFKFKNLTILDANFNLDKKRMKNILKIISDNSQKYNKKLIVNMECKPEFIDEEFIQIIKNCSFKINIEMGLQSTDKEVLKKANRPYDLDKIKNALYLLDNSNIKYKIDLMYGLPNDTFFKFLNSTRFILNNAKTQNTLPAHHFMLLNNTRYYKDKNIQRLSKDNSSIVIKTNTQNLIDFHKTKLFVEMINNELKLTQ